MGCLLISAVCVSSLIIAEIKRIIKESEIMKYGIHLPGIRLRANVHEGKMTLSGLKRTAMDGRN